MRRLVGVVLVGALVLLVARTLVRIDWGPKSPQSIAPLASQALEREPAANAALSGSESDVRAQRSAAVAQAPELEPDVAAPARPAASTAASAADALEVCPLLILFVGPDRNKLTLQNTRLRFVGADGRAWLFEEPAATQATRVALPAGTYRLTAEADGHRHVQETRVLAHCDASDPSERVSFWPERWIPIVVRTSAGRPFHALAEDLGYEPKRFFDGAFSAAVSRSPFAEDGRTAPESQALATFRPPGGYQVTAIGDDVAGSLELHVAETLWVGLWIHGSYYDSRVLAPGDREVVFTLDLPALDARFASVRARIVEPGSHVAATDVSATIKSDRSAHRRDDLQDRIPDMDGNLLFERVMPGEQELVVARGASIVQRRFDLRAGEELDLGEIPLGAGPGVRLRTIDVLGRPRQATVEIAPYRRGARVTELYHPNLWRKTDRDGVYELPLPDRPSIVRCREYRSGGHAPVATRNVLVDPEHPPLELVVTLDAPLQVGFVPRVPWEKRYRMTLEDDLGLVMATHLSPREKVEVVPGAYVVRLLDGEVELRSETVDVTAGSGTIEAP